MTAYIVSGPVQNLDDLGEFFDLGWITGVEAGHPMPQSDLPECRDLLGELLGIAFHRVCAASEIPGKRHIAARGANHGLRITANILARLIEIGETWEYGRRVVM